MTCVRVFHVFQPHMPLFSIYSLALEQDQEQSVGLQQANTTLHTQTFIQVGALCVQCKVAVAFHFQLQCQQRRPVFVRSASVAPPTGT